VLPRVQPPAAAPPGETALAKASEAIPSKEAIQWDLSPVPQARERPRTLAAARKEEPRLYGERMKQEGGTRRLAAEASFDTKATPFGAYDQLIIEAIQKRWYDLLEDRDYSRGRRGKVVVEFRLSSNGQISGMRVTENEVTELLALLCQRAIQEPAPYAPWPADMRRMLGSDTREVRFTFHYN
jgi:outer membrane biosynthesis protein TonB